MSPHQEGIPSVGLHVLYEPEKSGGTLVDVVFVHGLGGHPIRSWQYNDRMTSTIRSKVDPLAHNGSLRLLIKRARSLEKKPRLATLPRSNTRPLESNAPLLFWPRDLLPVACPAGRTITWGYHTLLHGGVPVIPQPDLFSHAKDLLQELGGLRAGTDAQHRPLVFVAHSLGGIIVKEVLRLAESGNLKSERDILSSTAAVVFFGCPHRATEEASLAETVLSTAEASFSAEIESSIFSFLYDTASPKWGELQESFVRLWHHFNFVVKTYQEGQGNADEPISSRIEASKLGDAREDAESLPADHRMMCQFKAASDAGFKSLAKVVQDITRDEKLKRQELNAAETSCLQQLTTHRVRGSRLAIRDGSLGTCRRICSTKEFCRWYRRQDGSHEHLLWLTGAPGSGKSTQLRHVRCQMEKQWEPGTTSIIYCTAEGRTPAENFASESKFGDMRSVTTIRSMISQLFVHDPTLREKLSRLCEGDINDAELTRFFLDDYIGGKPRTLARRTFIFVDVDDSCDDKYIRELLYCLCQMARSSDFSICLASRPISEAVPDNILQLQLEDHNREDIAWSVQSRITADWEERPVFVKKIAEKAGSSFLWAQLATDLLNKTIDSGAVHDIVNQVLEELPTDLYRLLEWTLGTLSSKEKADATTIMRWVMLSPEPMMLNDLRMAVRLGRTNFLLCSDLQAALDVGLPWSMQELQKIGKEFDTPSQFYQWLCSRTCGLLEARPTVDAQQSLGLQHVYPINESIRSFFLCGRGFAAISSGRATTTPPDHVAVDLCHYSLLHTILVYLNTSDLSPLVSRRHSPERKQRALSLEASPVWRRDQRKLITSSYPFLGYAVDNLLYHLLSPRPARYFLPQLAIFRTFASNDCRLWRRWTALLGETDASAILARSKSAGALLRPEIGASFRLERVFRAVNKIATGDSWFSPRTDPTLPRPRLSQSIEDGQVARQKLNMTPGVPSLPIPSRAARRGPRSRGTMVVTRKRV